MLIKFAADTVTDWVSCAYKKLDRSVFKGDAIKTILRKFAHKYFVYVAVKIHDGEDEYINKKFAEFNGVKTNIEILNILITLCMKIVDQIDLRIVSEYYEFTLASVHKTATEIAQEHVKKAIECPDDIVSKEDEETIRVSVFE